ncbi:MAG TPA: aldehyde:ferredoxin oxidoreductase, partial [Candidatus Bathyarchaeota archaeon]|nr:aldehyde:ferredoxin oxidoreductase [Candidatus Bathyarchaeota archaeon]
SRELTQMFNLCTGVQMDVSNVLRAAERVINLERCFNVREGVTRRDDTLPDRYFKEPLPDGPYRGEALDRDAFERMKDEYYAMRGWNTETGIPTKEKLLELGLTYAAEELERLGKLPEKM